ncbi:glycosyltransferase family 4 protein [Candidatus Nomurabacteria bacterium]|nr:glycosyltransferase family 4 protein [Candidatus Nomurabacteria bacterium]
MKIGIDIRALTPSKRSGIGSYIFWAIKNIIELDQENEYYLFSSGRKKAKFFPKEFEAKNVQHFHLNFPNKLLNLAFFFGFGPSLNKFFPVKLDLFWLPNINFIKLDPETKLILTIHDLSFLHSKNFYDLKRKLWHKLVNVRSLAERAKQIISVSQHTKRDVMRFFTVEEDKIKVVYPGIQHYQINKETAKKVVKDLNIADKFFIYLGTLEPRKNIESVIKAFDRYHLEYPETDLVLVGNKGWLYQKLLLSIKKRPYVKYLGFIDGLQKDALYSLSQALIWPSFYEGFGFPPLEATMHKKPVITSYKTSLPEIMQNQALYVDPYNVSEIYQLLKLISTDQALLDRISKGAENFKFYFWPEQAQRIINLLKKCE